MKKLPFRITLDSPCSEDLNNMQDTACGKFCNSCQKEVYDFTRLSDNEIYKIMQTHKGKVCAQLTTKQLQNGFTYTEETYNNNAWLKYAASILFLGGITNAFSQTAVWEFKPTKTELQDKTTPKSISKDSIYIQGSIINAVTNKPLIYPMLVEIQTENNKLTTGLSDKYGSFNCIISKTVNLKNLKIVLHYQTSKNDTIQVPKEQVSIEKTSNENEYKLVIRTAVNSLIIPNENDKTMSIRGENGLIFYIDGLVRTDVPIKSGGISIQEVQVIPSGTPANMESKPIDPNLQNR